VGVVKKSKEVACLKKTTHYRPRGGLLEKGQRGAAGARGKNVTPQKVRDDMSTLRATGCAREKERTAESRNLEVLKKKV